ncbi:MAG: formimidoylglutamase [Clostridiaceae bacterium]|nr:formimidoylglutamase [Clostridiaceae bacterium]
MFNKNYKVTDEKVWQGRIDSERNFDAFRWHQWVEKIDLQKDDLIPYEGKLGFAFIGFCCDEGVNRNKGRTGAANGPKAIRKEMANLPCSFTKDIQLFDAGDIFCEGSTLEESQSLLAQAVEKILHLNLFPIVLGGGHEIAFGHYNGILNYQKDKVIKPNIGIINFDAHFDLRSYANGATSGTMFRQIADLCKEQEVAYHYLCIGVQQHSNTVELFKTADRLGASYILAKDIAQNDIWNMLEKLDEFIKLKDQIYITICSDVFSSAFAPGVSSTQPLGLDPEQVLKFIKYILRSKKVISFDIAEVSPRFDQDNTTANLASVLIYSVINTLSKIYDLSR